MTKKTINNLFIILLNTLGEFLIIIVGVNLALNINNLSDWNLLNLFFGTSVGVGFKFFGEYIKDKTKNK